MQYLNKNNKFIYLKLKEFFNFKRLFKIGLFLVIFRFILVLFQSNIKYITSPDFFVNLSPLKWGIVFFTIIISIGLLLLLMFIIHKQVKLFKADHSKIAYFLDLILKLFNCGIINLSILSIIGLILPSNYLIFGESLKDILSSSLLKRCYNIFSEIMGDKFPFTPIISQIELDKLETKASHSFLRNNKLEYPKIVRGFENWLYTNDGRKIFDGACGAAVSSLGHGNQRLANALIRGVENGTPYLSSAFFKNSLTEELCKELILSTDGKMSSVYLCGSGSEAAETSLKSARQFFVELGQTSRVNVIYREGSYHGNTLGALSVSGFPSRKATFLPLLNEFGYQISACNEYRQRLDGETDLEFVAKKRAELEEKFQELGPNTVMAVIIEPIVGAAQGCVTPVPGYLEAMRDVCHKHGALLIFDEVMCGMGRTGYMHA